MAGWRVLFAMKAGRAAWRWLEAFAFLILLAVSLPPASPALGSSEERLRQACNTCRGIADRFTQVGGKETRYLFSAALGRQLRV